MTQKVRVATAMVYWRGLRKCVLVSISCVRDDKRTIWNACEVYRNLPKDESSGVGWRDIA